MKNKKIVFIGLVFAIFAGVVFTVSAATKVTLKVEKNGKGTISSDDGKINCGSDCKEVYSSGGSIHLYATSAKGFAFDKWTGNACGDAIGVGISTSTEITIGQCQVSLNYNNNKTITAVAHFKKTSGSSSSKSSSSRSSMSSSSKSSKSSATSSVYMLKINKSGKGYVSDGGRLNCGTNCKEGYWPGSEVKLTAVPDGGYVFEKFLPEKECTAIYSGGFGFNDNQWTKQAFAYGVGENVVCVTIMNKNKAITAIFKKISSSSSSSKSSSSKSYSSKSSSSSSVPNLTKEIILQLLKDSLFDSKCSSERVAGEYGSCSIDISKTDSKWIVAVTYDGLYDDSIKAIKTRATVIYQDKQWIKQNVSKTQQCWLGRGHQDFSSKPCL